MLFISHISTGLGLPISSFFLLLLEDFDLQLQHLAQVHEDGRQEDGVRREMLKLEAEIFQQQQKK